MNNYTEQKMIQEAGNTCIFFHKACLSQHVLGENTHHQQNIKMNHYIKLSTKKEVEICHLK